jgi:hypothetical protein
MMDGRLRAVNAAIDANPRLTGTYQYSPFQGKDHWRARGPASARAMMEAFDNAWRDLEASGNIFSSQFPADWARDPDR